MTKTTKPQRLPKGTGSIMFSNGKWYWRRRQAGTNLLSVPCDTREAAEQLRLDYVLKSPRQSPVRNRQSSVPTLNDFALQCLEGDYGNRIATSTWETNDTHRRQHLAPSRIGRLRVDRITPKDCQEFADSITATFKRKVPGSPSLAPEERGLGGEVLKPKYIEVTQAASPTYRRRVVATVSRIMSIAARQGLIAQNPFAHIDLPKVVERENRTLAPDEAAVVLNPVTRMDKMIALALWTGAGNKVIREALWEHFDIKRRLWHVHDSKNAHRPRTVPLCQEAIDLLATIDRRSEYVFCTASGKKIERGNFQRDWTIRKGELGIPKATRFQDLRGSYISLMLESGANVREVMELVGHSNPKTTLKSYARGRDPRKAEAVDRMAEAIRNAKA